MVFLALLLVVCLGACSTSAQSGPAFEVWVGPFEQPVLSESVMKLRNVKQNLGFGYNALTGHFTAPRSGTYLFWVQVTKTRGPYLAVHLIKEGIYIGFSKIMKDGTVTQSVVTATHLEAGQNVWVKIFGAQSLYHGYHTRFGGRLLA